MGTRREDLKWLYVPDIFEIESSFLLITSAKDLDLTVAFIEFYQRDYDILEVSLGAHDDSQFKMYALCSFYFLGEFPYRHLVTSNQCISERTINKIDKVSSSMAEHGFYQFYQSLVDFQQNWMVVEVGMITHKDNYEVNLEPITIEQLKKPIIIALCLNGIATILFVAEICVYKWLQWRNRKLLTDQAKCIVVYTSDPIVLFYFAGRVQILPLVEIRPKPRPRPKPAEISLKRYHTARLKMKNTKKHSKHRRSAIF